MQTKEFVKRIKELGFMIRISYYIKDPSMRTERRMLIINRESNSCVVSIWIDRVYEFDTDRSCFEKLPEETKKKLFELLVEYSSTPIKKKRKIKKDETYK